MDKPEEVVLRQAFAWDCPHCGARDNFVTAIEAELTDEEQAALMKYMATDEGEEWKRNAEALAEAGMAEGCGLVTSPDEITCPKCGKTCKVFTEPGARMPPGFDPHTDL